MTLRWRRRRQPPTPEPARVEPTRPAQRIDPVIANQMEREDSFGVWFPPSHRTERGWRDQHE